MLVKEYMKGTTHIRIFDDYCSTQAEEKETRDILIALLLKKLNDENTIS